MAKLPQQDKRLKSTKLSKATPTLFVFSLLPKFMLQKIPVPVVLFSGGLFICLERFAGLCIDHVKGYCERTARKGFLWYKQTKKALPESEEPQDKVKKVRILGEMHLS